MVEDKTGIESHYWYGDVDQRKRAVELLEAVRTFRTAEAAMQRRTQASMGMGENDLLALRYLIREHRDGRGVGPKELAGYLGISSASTTVLLDRLEKGGHVRRENSPFDRRALIVVPTATTDSEIAAALGDVYERLVEVAAKLTPEEAKTVITFLTDMRDAVDQIDVHVPPENLAAEVPQASQET